MLKLVFLSLGLIVAMVSPTACIGQDNKKTQQQQEFEKFQNYIKKNFNQFTDRNDSLFLSFLEGAWKEFTLYEEQVKRRPKPVEQPSVSIKPDSMEKAPSKHTIDTFGDVGKENFQGFDNPLPDEADKPVIGTPRPGTSIDFYGHEISMPSITQPLSLGSIGQNDIIDFYKSYLRQKELTDNANELIREGKELRLNDWGIVQLMMIASEYYFHTLNERVLFTWITLLRNGYDVKIGHDRRQIYLLPRFTGKLYNDPYVTISGKRYYIILLPGQDLPMEGITSFEASYPGESHALSLLLPELPLLNEQPTFRDMIYHQDTVKVQLAKSLIQFLHSYPTCELSVYFNAPISEKTIKSLDKKLLPLLVGKTEEERVNLLLDFVQHAIPYKTDEQQFGEEHYLFGDETLYFPYADCEDRAVLFTRLTKRYTGLKAIGLDYPDHVSAGIRFSKQIKGDLIIFEGDNYFICDPTYIGAMAGMEMEGMQQIKPTVITCE